MARRVCSLVLPFDASLLESLQEFLCEAGLSRRRIAFAGRQRDLGLIVGHFSSELEHGGGH